MKLEVLCTGTVRWSLKSPFFSTSSLNATSRSAKEQRWVSGSPRFRVQGSIFLRENGKHMWPTNSWESCWSGRSFPESSSSVDIFQQSRKYAVQASNRQPYSDSPPRLLPTPSVTTYHMTRIHICFFLVLRRGHILELMSSSTLEWLWGDCGARTWTTRRVLWTVVAYVCHVSFVSVPSWRCIVPSCVSARCQPLLVTASTTRGTRWTWGMRTEAKRIWSLVGAGGGREGVSYGRG